MDYEKYKNKMSYPEIHAKPKKPDAPNHFQATSVDYKEYIGKLEEYVKTIEKYEKLYKDYECKIEAYLNEGIRLQDQFKHDAMEELNIINNPKAEKLWELVNRDRDNEGMPTLFCFLEDYSELIK